MRLLLLSMILMLINFSTRGQGEKNKQTGVYNQGVNYFMDGKFIDAIHSFTNAINLDSSDKDAFYNRGISYYKMGDIEKACNDWRHGYFLNDTLAITKII